MLKRFTDLLVTGSTIVGAVSLLLMMVLIVADVVSSNLFNQPIPAGSAIVTHYGMVLVAFLPLALAERMGNHVSVDVVVERLPARVQQVLLKLVQLFSAIICLGLVYGLWGAAFKKMNVGSYIFEQGISIKTWPGQFVLPFSFGLLALVLIASLFTRGDKTTSDHTHK